MNAENADLVVGFWREYRLRQGTRAERVRAESEGDASDQVNDRVTDDPVAALLLLDDLLAAPDADVPYFGAGPLEDLLVQHGPMVAQAVADRCAHSFHWREAVGGVWLDDQEWSVVAPLHGLLPKRE